MALITYPTYLTGHPSQGAPGSTYSTNHNGVLTRRGDVAGREYVWLLGVANTAVGSWVAYDEDGVTALLDTDVATTMSVGIAVATAAVTASLYGWYVIFGEAEGLCLADFADDGLVYATSTAGSVDDADVTLAIVQGAVGRGARDTTTGTAIFQLNYPNMVRAAFD